MRFYRVTSKRYKTLSSNFKKQYPSHELDSRTTTHPAVGSGPLKHSSHHLAIVTTTLTTDVHSYARPNEHSRLFGPQTNESKRSKQSAPENKDLFVSSYDVLQLIVNLK